MSHIKIFFNEFYDYNKKEFWLLIASNIALGVAINYIPLHAFLQAGVVFIMVMKTFSFLRSASIMPSISSDFDRYSWKYFQGLPLSKRELIISLILSNVFVMFPLLVWLMSFFPQIAGLFVDDGKTVEWQIPIKIFIAAIPIFFLISSNSLINQIQFPRKQYSKIPAKVRFLNSLKWASVALATLFYAFYFYDKITDFYGIELGSYIEDGFKLGGKLIKSWFLAPVLFFIAYKSYQAVLKVWQNEKKSYSDIKWIPKRDVPITVIALLLIAAPIMRIDWKIPGMYEGSELLSATFHKDYKKISHLIKSGHDINQSNSNGFTPIMVAAYQGDLETYNLLLKYGASPKGEVHMSKKDFRTGMNIFILALEGKNIRIVSDLLKKGHSANDKNNNTGLSAIHYASINCSPDIVDLLIENKADLKVKNKKNQTALHLAANSRCFSVISSLLDNGVDHLAKDNEKKTALEYLEKQRHNKELVYYVQKKTRAPASIKK